ncbi:DNA helicase UvrD [Candidatus Gottesmanbacteria bacterium]|nr:DNA helicase UvrD [Candidatus Gottesmanbacteria bacterium]
MQLVCDLQIHSKYARAVSQEMVLPKIWEWAKRKGIDLVATGDWTHPLWMREIKANLIEDGSGLLKLKTQNSNIKSDKEPLFLLATEVSSIYSQGGKVRRIHTLIWVSSIETAEKINKELTRRGANLMSDGRPIIGLSSIQVAELVLTIDAKALIIPAHCWTPWYSLYGSESGFDSIDECFGSYAKYIYAIETGLSSDPLMNWRIKELDRRSIVSFSDAHSGPKLMREATVFEMEKASFQGIREAIVGKSDTSRIVYTIEFYPEEGKYHYTGHRNCGVKQTPSETREKGTMCPVCGRKLTVGVMHRVDQLAGRTEEELRIKKRELSGLKINGISSEAFPERPAYVMMVPLTEIIAESMNTVVTSVSVRNEYFKLTDHLGGEFFILFSKPLDEISRVSGTKIAEAVGKVREGSITVDPGYDGVFGVVKIWRDEQEVARKDQKKQLSLF